MARNRTDSGKTFWLKFLTHTVHGRVQVTPAAFAIAAFPMFPIKKVLPLLFDQLHITVALAVAVLVSGPIPVSPSNKAPTHQRYHISYYCLLFRP